MLRSTALIMGDGCPGWAGLPVPSLVGKALSYVIAVVKDPFMEDMIAKVLTCKPNLVIFWNAHVSQNREIASTFSVVVFPLLRENQGL